MVLPNAETLILASFVIHPHFTGPTPQASESDVQWEIRRSFPLSFFPLQTNTFSLSRLSCLAETPAMR